MRWFTELPGSYRAGKNDNLIGELDGGDGIEAGGLGVGAECNRASGVVISELCSLSSLSVFRTFEAGWNLGEPAVGFPAQRWIDTAYTATVAQGCTVLLPLFVQSALGGKLASSHQPKSPFSNFASTKVKFTPQGS